MEKGEYACLVQFSTSSWGAHLHRKTEEGMYGVTTCQDCSHTGWCQCDELLVDHLLHVAKEGCLTSSCTTCEEKAAVGVGNELVCEHLLLVLCVYLCLFHVHRCSIAGSIWVRRVLKSLSRKLL